MRIVSFRPGVIGNNTAFECMASIYKYLQERHGYSFTMVKSEDDPYEDRSFRIISIPRRLWKPIEHTPFFRPSLSRSTRLARCFSEADGVLTVDPINYPQGLLAIRIALKKGIPVWFDTSVTLMGTGRDVRSKIAKRIIRADLESVAGIVATVPKCIERFQDLALFNERIAPKFHIMGHPVDCSVFRPRPEVRTRSDMIRVLAVTRLVPEKGLLYILEAIDPLMRECERLRLQILGEGPLKPLLEREVRERRLEDRVDFLSPVPHGSLPPILSAADIFVNHAVGTSGWEEFFGVVNLEAMACGLPAVMSTNGGLHHVVRGEDVAILVPERDTAGIRKALRRLIEDATFRQELGARGRRYVQEHYDITVIGEKYRRMLEAGRGKW